MRILQNWTRANIIPPTEKRKLRLWQDDNELASSSKRKK